MKRAEGSNTARDNECPPACGRGTRDREVTTAREGTGCAEGSVFSHMLAVARGAAQGQLLFMIHHEAVERERRSRLTRAGG